MSDSIILEMAGVFGYLDNIRLDENEKYDSMANEFEELIKKLCEFLPENERYEMFKKLDDLHSSMMGMSTDEHFKLVLSSGLQLPHKVFWIDRTSFSCQAIKGRPALKSAGRFCFVT